MSVGDFISLSVVCVKVSGSLELSPLGNAIAPVFQLSLQIRIGILSQKIGHGYFGELINSFQTVTVCEVTTHHDVDGGIGIQQAGILASGVRRQIPLIEFKEIGNFYGDFHAGISSV